MYNELKSEIESLKDEKKARILQWFFKTGKWQYWEWDIFYGIMVPDSRKIVRKYYKLLSFAEIKMLMNSKIHEERLIWALILVERFEKWDENIKKEIFNFYMENLYWINNWDLVDLSAPKIVWLYLKDKSIKKREILFKLILSPILWERRVGVLATFAFIRNMEFGPTLQMCELLMNDKHDLMHKATWWMLREIWKKDEQTLKKFLDENFHKMPRTMLRYAIERLDPESKSKYMKK